MNLTKSKHEALTTQLGPTLPAVCIHLWTAVNSFLRPRSLFEPMLKDFLVFSAVFGDKPVQRLSGSNTAPQNNSKRVDGTHRHHINSLCMDLSDGLQNYYNIREHLNISWIFTVRWPWSFSWHSKLSLWWCRYFFLKFYMVKMFPLLSCKRTDCELITHTVTLTSFASLAAVTQ